MQIVVQYKISPTQATHPWWFTHTCAGIELDNVKRVVELGLAGMGLRCDTSAAEFYRHFMDR
jgi:hypothetical protein